METEIDLRLVVKVPENDPPFHAIVHAVVNGLRAVPPRLLREYAAARQERILEAILGPRYHPLPAHKQAEAPWACPRCASRRGFRRKGRRQRERTLRTKAGEVRLPLAQVRCEGCRRVFAPLLQVWHLKPYERVTEDLAYLFVRLALEFPFERSTGLLDELIGVSASPATAWRHLQQAGQTLDLSPDRCAYPLLQIDGTRVCAGEPERGIPFLVALSPRERDTSGPRPRNHLDLAGIVVNEGADVLLQPLADRPVGTALTDGDPDLLGAIHRQLPGAVASRCRWHVDHQLEYCLTLDHMPRGDRAIWHQRLRSILYDDQAPTRSSRLRLDRLSRDLEESGCPRAAAHLRGAKEAVFAFKDPTLQPCLPAPVPATTTSLVERSMREANRRTDVGVRWSVPGVTHLLTLFYARRYHHPGWSALWSCPDRDAIELRLENSS